MVKVDGKFLIGIPTYNGWRRVDALLNNLRQRTPADIQHTIVVCDDSGKDEHRNRVRSICQRWGAQYIQNPRNMGVPASWNALTRSLPDHEYVVLLNDDVLMDNGWLRPLGYALSKNQKVAAFSVNFLYIMESDTSRLLSGPDAKIATLQLETVSGNLVRNRRFDSIQQAPEIPPVRVMCPAGCAFGFRREIYDMVGGFDERYFAFFEETDLGVACAEKGFPSFVLSVPWHNYHIWSATFATAPEINAGQVMQDSKRKFLEKWGQRLGRPFREASEIHPFLMDRIPQFEVRWMGLNGDERVDTR